MNNSYTILKTPIKVGDEANVASYAASLAQGEEQLLITRNGKLFLTDGKRGFFSFRVNEIYTSKEIDDKVTINTGMINEKIESLLKITAVLGVQFDKCVLKNDYDILKLSLDDSIYKMDSRLIEFKNDSNHDNKDVLDLLTKDSDGNLLFNNAKLAVDMETIEGFIVTNAEADSAITDVWNEVGI